MSQPTQHLDLKHARRWLPSGKTVGLLAIAFLIISCGVAGGWLAAELRDVPEVSGLEERRPNLVTSILARDGSPLGQLYIERRIMLDDKDIPEQLAQAFIAVEDRRFYDHFGVDPLGILRAVIANLRQGRVVEGGSTITQQLAKNLFLTPEQSLRRKIKEAVLALAIERRYTKRQILTMYANQIYLGQGAYGVEAAAQTYFHRSVGELNLAEIALIAGLPKAPSRYNPFAHPEMARKRRDKVLKNMLQEGFITQADFDEAVATPVKVQRLSGEERLAPYFVAEVRRRLLESFGRDRLYSAGLKVYTTLDPDLQQAANEAIHRGVDRLAKQTKALDAEGNPEIEAALLAMDPQDGSILAMVGGDDFERSEFNRAVQAARQVGSAFKPIVYTAAIDNGYTAADMIADEPIEFTDSEGKRWAPANYDRTFRGRMTLRRALETSRNIPAVKLLADLGPDLVIRTARRMGIETPLRPFLSLALGSQELNMMELVRAYGVLASGGVRVKPRLIRYISDRRDRLVTEVVPHREAVLSPETAYVMTQLLHGVVTSGTGKVAKDLPGFLAAKTGTSNDYTDAWFVGYSPEVVAAVWVGKDKKSSLGRGMTGGRAAGPIWVSFMKAALEKTKREPPDPPPGVIFVPIDETTGYKAGHACPRVRIEVFRRGTEPRRVCPIHD